MNMKPISDHLRLESGFKLFKKLMANKNGIELKDSEDEDSEESSSSQTNPKAPLKQLTRHLTKRAISPTKSSKKSVFGSKSQTKKRKKKLSFSIWDHINFFLPEGWFSSSKKRLFLNGMDMIDEKLDIKNIVHSLNELEKLKLLLFDENQYYIFEHIPKPILFDQTILEAEEDKKARKKKERLEKSKKKLEKTSLLTSSRLRNEKSNGILTCNAQFWQRCTLEEKEENFRIALKQLKMKANPNIIDQRLIKIIEDMVDVG